MITTQTKNTPHVIKSIEELNKKAGDKVLNCLTGMRPSGRLHLGHYKWALENWLKLQESPNIKNNFLIADYQVLGDHLGETERLRTSVIDMVIDWLAVGLDPNKSNFIVQSYVPEFAELFNLLTMFVPYSLATNNPTLKDEMKKIELRWSKENSSISLGFINYPVSQVADIMLPRGWIVPVWEDQIPHIELARKIIKKVNTMYGTNYPLPLALISENPRLVGTDGNDKMSKSLGNTIYLTATLKEITTWVNSMYTDTGKTSIESKWNIEKHVVFKYLDIFYNDKKHIKDLKKRYIEWWPNSLWDWEIKKLLIQVLEELISPIRERREYYKNNMDLVISAIEKWSLNARIEWQKLLTELKEKMGILDYGREFRN
ncbi:MAG: Tryptophanyl-tRNA synthetase [uncultured bacterium (gcode 4)]|uniref:Tryptophan--tRNA ligase n=1 Tax=uncultured bacterium (gcode 4) TaxID=1234023 RepID=K2BWV6_9BACT|nr:MAG: Tryptophanyl-tRNA synthetase [uncultured bacterium (gcode 4)]